LELASFDGLWWLILLAGPLIFLQRRLHFEVQAIYLLFTRRADIAMVLFALTFFPGVLLHESSHYLMAWLLRVDTGRFSLIPRPLPDGRLQLGYVETADTDWVRDALIGAAPLLAGSAFVAYAGLARLGLASLLPAIQGGPGALVEVLAALPARQDFWLWFYLTLTVSATMFPSDSDRRAWLPLGLMVALGVALALLGGAGPWMLATFGSALNQALRAAAGILGISLVVQGILLPPLFGLRRLLSRALNLQVQ
jgi:hypothetical protein